LAIKKTVDEDYRPGRFLLTSSANVLTLPRVADSLAGRMETLRMLPLCHAEIVGAGSTFLDRLFAGALEGDKQAIVGDDLVQLALMGGGPRGDRP
jgi:predicted AAA+ superfamily ATPase